MTPEEFNADLATSANKDGVALFNSGDLKGARSKFQHALELNPHDRLAQRNLAHTEAELAFQENDYAGAIDAIREAIRLGRADLSDRLAYFQREQARVEAEKRRLEAERREEARQRAIAIHDAAMIEASRDAIASEKARWTAEAPVPAVTESAVDGIGSRELLEMATEKLDDIRVWANDPLHRQEIDDAIGIATLPATFESGITDLGLVIKGKVLSALRLVGVDFAKDKAQVKAIDLLLKE